MSRGRGGAFSSFSDAYDCRLHLTDDLSILCEDVLGARQRAALGIRDAVKKPYRSYVVRKPLYQASLKSDPGRALFPAPNLRGRCHGALSSGSSLISQG